MAKRETRLADKDALAPRANGQGEALRLAFAANFKIARAKAGMTQIDIACLTGIAQTYVSSIECGKQNPTLDTMAILAEAVGSDVRTLLKLPPQPAKSAKRPPR